MRERNLRSELLCTDTRSRRMHQHIHTPTARSIHVRHIFMAVFVLCLAQRSASLHLALTHSLIRSLRSSFHLLRLSCELESYIIPSDVQYMNIIRE